MSKLKSLREKYGFSGGNYEPKPDCKFCHGTGERQTRLGLRFCICLFVEPDFSDVAGETLAATARKLRGEMFDAEGGKE